MTFEKEDSKGVVGGRVRQILRFLALSLLLGLVFFETYYIFRLRERFSARSEELKSMSMELQSLKNERGELHEELSSIKYSAREDADGNSSDR